jgi:hypothetical protein
MLEDYSGGSQQQSTIDFTATGSQPGTGTSFQWSESGTLQFVGQYAGEDATVTANGNCSRGGSSVSVTYTVTIGGQQYSAPDSTDPQYKAISCHRPLYCRYYDSDTTTTDTAGPPTWVFLSNDYLYVVSNIGDPLDLADFQERYPGPNFYWQGNAGQGPAPDYGMPSVSQVGFQVQWNKPLSTYFVAGSAGGVPVNPGYTYHSKACDQNGGSWSQDISPGLTIYQFIFAATTDTTPGALGIQQSACDKANEFAISMWSTGVARIPDGN